MSVSLETRYLGMALRHPLVASASPLSRTMQGLRALEEGGAAAIVMPSLFEEQIEHGEYEIHAALEVGTEFNPEATSMLPEMLSYNTGPDAYLDLITTAATEITVPVIPSLNGASPGGWTSYARRFEEAGAPAVELNVYFVAGDPDETSADVEARYLRIVEQVREAITVPLAVKVGPYFSSMGNMARRLVDCGADGLVLFNRFYQPDIDLEALEVVPNLTLSTPWEARLPLRWIALLHGRVDASLAATTGIHDHIEAVKLLMAGADVTMMASALLRHGPGWIRGTREALIRWLDEHGYESVEQMKGSMSHRGAPNPSAFERANYMESLISYS